MMRRVALLMTLLAIISPTFGFLSAVLTRSLQYGGGRAPLSALSAKAQTRKIRSGKAQRGQRKQNTKGAASYEELATQQEAECFSPKPQYGSLDNCPVLVLNSDCSPLSYLPLSLWPWQYAMKAVCMDRVHVLATYGDRVIRSARAEYQLPSVVALKTYVKQRSNVPAFTRRALYLRDLYQCQYCRKYFDVYDLTFDHVTPKCHGGRTEWANVVTCCSKCNNRKADTQPKHLHRIGMSLKTPPRAPTHYELNARAKLYPPHNRHESWDMYLSTVLEDDE
ncbi:unnamed protein product [Chrysoparadoxa australica]